MVEESTLRALLGLSLPRLGTPQLLLIILLVVPLALADGGSTCDGLGAEVWTVALLGGGADDGLVELAGWGGGVGECGGFCGGG